jgi:hypothetical protein
MSDIDQLKVIIQGMESKHNERHDQQLIFNGQVNETLKSINTAINKLDVFQSEMNSTNNAVDHLRITQERHSEQIAKINEGRAGDKTLLDELKQWRILIFGSFAAAIITAIITLMIPKDNDTAILKILTELSEKAQPEQVTP